MMRIHSIKLLLLHGLRLPSCGLSQESTFAYLELLLLFKSIYWHIRGGFQKTIECYGRQLMSSWRYQRLRFKRLFWWFSFAESIKGFHCQVSTIKRLVKSEIRVTSLPFRDVSSTMRGVLRCSNHLKTNLLLGLVHHRSEVLWSFANGLWIYHSLSLTINLVTGWASRGAPWRSNIIFTVNCMHNLKSTLLYLRWNNPSWRSICFHVTSQSVELI